MNISQPQATHFNAPFISGLPQMHMQGGALPFIPFTTPLLQQQQQSPPSATTATAGQPFNPQDYALAQQIAMQQMMQQMYMQYFNHYTG